MASRAACLLRASPRATSCLLLPLALPLPTPNHPTPLPACLPACKIIDLMVLVVDAAKGIQTQTAECIVIGEVAAADLVVALNKTGGVGGAVGT